MKKTIPPGNKARRFIAMLICCSALLLMPNTISAQSTCSAAMNLPSVDTSMVNQSSNQKNVWFKFVANDPRVTIWLYNNDTANVFTSLTLYTGTCASLTQVATGISVGADIVLYDSVLTNGVTYYLNANRSSTATITFGLTTQFSVVSLTPCPCPSSLYNPNNTCEGICNGGFDYHIGTLNNWNQVGKACPWSAAPKNTSTPYTVTTTTDLFAADGSGLVDVPSNDCGTQDSHSNLASTSRGYGGIICWSNHPLYDTNLREYLEAPLQYTLQAGKTYVLSFWISLADNSGASVRNIGAFVQSGLIFQNAAGSHINIPVGAPTVMWTSNVTNDATWMQISGTITANGGEDHIIIGQFTGNTGAAPLAHTPANPASGTTRYAYYYIDDVSLVPVISFSVTSSPNPACTGVPISVTASCTGSSGTYNWTASSGSFSCTSAPCPTFTTTATGATYTVTTTLPAYGSCITSTTYTPPTLAGPTAAGAGVDQNICLGGSAMLTGTAAGTYNTTAWSDVNGTPLCSSCTSYTVTPTVTSQYVFTVTNTTTGCVRRDTMKVTVTPIPVHILSSTGLATCDVNANVFTTQPSTFSTYTWTTNAPTYSGQTTSALTATWGSNFIGNGYVVVNVVDASGCKGKDSIIVPQCCKGMINLLTNTSTSANTTLFPLINSYQQATSTTIDINGIFTVNMNTRFKKCTVKLGPNAKIIISAGYKLELDSSFFYACSDMWDGIYVDGINTASEVRIIHYSAVEDAKNAIVSTSGGRFTIDGSNGRVKLNKNNIGVLVKPYQGPHLGTIKKTTISCDKQGQPGSSSFTTTSQNCIAPVSGKAYCAIYIDSCLNITIGDSTQSTYRNLMERQKFGIWAKNSTVKVWNNDLKYYTTTPNLPKSLPVDGVAIYAKGHPSLTRTLTVGRVGTYKAHNKIQKISYGVMVETAMNLNCEYNRIDSASIVGVYALNNQIGKTILINQDSITEFSGTGINCTNVKQSTVTITNNQLNETSSSSPTSFAYTGIYIANALNFTVSTVKIQANTVKRVRNGIWVLNVTRAQIFNNAITFYVGQPMTVAMPAIGIKLAAAHSSIVRNNSIANNNTAITTGSQLSGVYDKLFGIHVTSCINDTVTKNTVLKCGSGLFLKASNNPFLNGCNTFTSCYFGVNFGFTNNTPTSVITSSQFRWVNPVSGARTPTGDVWTSCFRDIEGKAVPAIGWYYNTSSSSLQPQNLTATTQLTIKDSTTTVSNQCAALLNPVTTGSAAELRAALLGGICKTPLTYDTLNSQYRYQDSLFAFRTLRDNPSWLSLGTGDDSYYSNWYSAVGSTNLGIMADVEDSLKAGKLIGATALLDGMTTHGTPEANRKTVMGIYLATWAKDSMYFDSLQIVTLTAIANLAPVSGGIGVYDARAMLFLEVHDSSALRLGHVHDEYVPTAHVYPNPSTGTLMLNYELPEGENGSMQLYDISGRMIRSYVLASGTAVQQFEAKEIPSGMYFCIVVVHDQAILTDKWILIKE